MRNQYIDSEFLSSFVRGLGGESLRCLLHFIIINIICPNYSMRADKRTLVTHYTSFMMPMRDLTKGNCYCLLGSTFTAIPLLPYWELAVKISPPGENEETGIESPSFSQTGKYTFSRKFFFLGSKDGREGYSLSCERKNDLHYLELKKQLFLFLSKNQVLLSLLSFRVKEKHQWP